MAFLWQCVWEPESIHIQLFVAFYTQSFQFFFRLTWHFVSFWFFVSLRYKDVSWKTAKGMMADVSFLPNLKELDVDNITQSQVKATKSKIR